MSEKVKNLFDEIAESYDLLNGLLSLSIDKRWRREAIASLQLPEHAQVLDLCAGTLAMSGELLKQHPLASVVALDFSDKMLKRGLSRLPVRQQRQIKAICADGLALPLRDNYFDAACCAYGMRNLDDNRKGLSELYRVLKPGASVAIVEFFRPTRFFPKLFQMTYGRWIIPLLGRLVSRHQEAYSYLRDSVKGFYSTEEYEVLLKEAGFKIVKLTRQTGGISTLIVARKLVK